MLEARTWEFNKFLTGHFAFGFNQIAYVFATKPAPAGLKN
jgi:hypothetical protein